MLSGTRREIVGFLSGKEAPATEIADELDLSPQTVHHHLKSLEADGYVRETGTRNGKTKPYKLFSATETSSLLSIYDGKIVDRNLELTDGHKLLFSVLEVPQTQFHFPLFSYLLNSSDTASGVVAIAVYGSVARGDATEESDIDLLFVTENDVATTPDAPMLVPASFEDRILPSGDTPRKRVVTVESFTKEELHEGLELDSQFLRSAVGESIILYDPNDVLRQAKADYVEQGGASSGVSGRGEGHP